MTGVFGNASEAARPPQVRGAWSALGARRRFGLDALQGGHATGGWTAERSGTLASTSAVCDWLHGRSDDGGLHAASSVTASTATVGHGSDEHPIAAALRQRRALTLAGTARLEGSSANSSSDGSSADSSGDPQSNGELQVTWLTGTALGDAGAASWTPAAELSSDAACIYTFRLQLELYAGNGTGGDGFVFSFGLTDAAALTELATHSAWASYFASRPAERASLVLRVRRQHAPVPAVAQVWAGGSLLWSGDTTLPRAQWASLVVALEAGSVR